MEKSSSGCGWALAVALVVLSGCGSEDEAESPARAGSSSDDPLTRAFVVQTTVESPEGRTSFLQLTERLDVDTLSRDAAIELAGNARLFQQGDRLFVGSGEAPEIQEYLPASNGSLTPGDTVSFASAGLGFTPFGHNFVSEDKAYLVDGAGQRILIWNPTALQLAGEIALDDTRLGLGFTMEIDPGIVRDDGLVFYLVQQQNLFDPTPAGLFAGVQVLVVNGDTDEVETVLEDTRCVGGYSGLTQSPDGSIYVLGDNYLLRKLSDDSLPGACVLRIAAGELAFDGDYLLDMQEATGSQFCSVLHAISDNVALTTCADPSAASINPLEDPFGFLAEPIARWWLVDLSAGEGSVDLGALGSLSVQSGSAFTVDGTTYVQLPQLGSRGANQLVEVSTDGIERPLFETTGRISGLGQVRFE